MLKNDQNNKYKVNTLLLDLSAAFDIVSHSKLLVKLKHFGFGQLALDFIESYLTGREVYVEVETDKSKKVKIRSGIPQGSVLGPLLYAIFIIDIKEINSHPKIIYADDTNCLVASKSKQQLQEDTEEAMEDLVEYYGNLQLKLNMCFYEGNSYKLVDIQVIEKIYEQEVIIKSSYI